MSETRIWRDNYALELDPGTWRKTIRPGFTNLVDARQAALRYLSQGEAKEVSIVRYSQSSSGVKDHVVEIVG